MEVPAAGALRGLHFLLAQVEAHDRLPDVLLHVGAVRPFLRLADHQRAPFARRNPTTAPARSSTRTSRPPALSCPSSAFQVSCRTPSLPVSPQARVQRLRHPIARMEIANTGVGLPQQNPAVRRAVAQNQAQARGHPPLDRTRRLQRPRRGRQQQNQGGCQAGLRLQEHRQPHRARHAQVLGSQTDASGEGRGVTPAHTNSLSLEENRRFARV